ncbi:hypothetical protein BGW39_011105 [Mortierella sp. 14UC]|nr:hypothetical protein BGW39_011105 [Mortierella sp. 14UC]
MTKKQTSSERSKQKTQGNQIISITNPAIFAQRQPSLASLADLDHESTTPTESKPSSSSTQKENKEPSIAVTTRLSLQQQQQQQKETKGDDLWSWIMATHTAVLPRSDSYLDPKQQQQQLLELDGAQGEQKKQAKSSGYETQRLKSLSLRGRDWVTLSALTVATMSVRLWRMDASPAEVALDEAHAGKYVDGYLKKEFTYDIHPPLGKLLLAGIIRYIDSEMLARLQGAFVDLLDIVKEQEEVEKYRKKRKW